MDSTKSERLIEHLTDSQWSKGVLESKIPVFVEFSASWCGPCHAMASVIASLAKEFNGKVKFVDVDVDKSPATTSRLDVFSVPTFMVFIGGKPRDRFVGMVTKDYLTKFLKSSMGAR